MKCAYCKGGFPTQTKKEARPSHLHCEMSLQLHGSRFGSRKQRNFPMRLVSNQPAAASAGNTGRRVRHDEETLGICGSIVTNPREQEKISSERDQSVVFLNMRKDTQLTLSLQGGRGRVRGGREEKEFGVKRSGIQRNSELNEARRFVAGLAMDEIQCHHGRCCHEGQASSTSSASRPNKARAHSQSWAARQERKHYD